MSLENDEEKPTDVFEPELFIELSEGQDDKIASDDDYADVELEQKDPGNMTLFSKLITAINDFSTIQASLAISTINSSIDFSSNKLRALFLQHGGVKAIFRALNNMTFAMLTPERRMEYSNQGIPRVDPRYGYESMLILATLSEISSDSRTALLAEDAIRVGLTLAKTQFAPSVSPNLVFQMKARALRMVAGCCKDARARNFLRRIQGIELLERLFRAAMKEFSSQQQPELGSFICSISMVFDQLMTSRRCKQAMIKTGGVQLLVDALNELPVNITVTDDILMQCGGITVNASKEDCCIESITNTLCQISLLQEGRAEIQVTKGINSVVELFKKTQSAGISQRAVAILANCAQDSGVDETVRTAGGLKYLSQLLVNGDNETIMAICRTIVAVCRSGPYFGSLQTTLRHEEKDYLSFNERNEENILELCKIGAVNNLGQHIDISVDALCCSDADNLLVTGSAADLSLRNAQALRNLCVEATNALVPLLSCSDGRKALKSNSGLFKALIAHLEVADTDVLTATLFALATAAKNDAELCKKIGESDGLRFMFTLLKHSNLQVVAAAAEALTPALHDKARSFKVGRSLTTSLEIIATLLKRKFEADSTDEYAARLVLECKGWLMGVVAELAADNENAKVLTEYEVLGTICELLKEHSHENSKCDKAYDFYIEQLIKEKAALAIAALSKIGDNAACVADMGAIPALVRAIQSPDGISIFDPITMRKHENSIEPIGVEMTSCTRKFGSEVNFNVTQEAQKQQQVDRDPQATNNPYFMVNKAVCKSMAEISKNKKCALLLRQNGAVYGLLTLVGHVDKETQLNSADAITQIRLHHINALEVYKKRLECEKLEEIERVRDAATILYQDQNCEIANNKRVNLADSSANNMSFEIRKNMTFNNEEVKQDEIAADGLFLEKTSMHLSKTAAGQFESGFGTTSILSGPELMEERIRSQSQQIRERAEKKEAVVLKSTLIEEEKASPNNSIQEKDDIKENIADSLGKAASEQADK